MPSMMTAHRPPMSAGKMGEKECCSAHACGHMGYGMGKKILMALVGVLLVYLICYIGSLARNDLKKYNFIGKADKQEHTIVVNGYGKVTGQNDIAMTTIGYSNTDKDVAKAQETNKKVMDQIMSELKNMGVAEKDMQSNYSIYPDYNYNPQKGQELIGYRVSNQITVKIRDLSKIPNILGLAGKYGATEVGGLTFTIDDPENLKAQAREKAMADAKSKAQRLSASLGVTLGDVVSYSEYEGADYSAPMYNKYMGAEGGGISSAAPAVVAAGSNDVIMNNSIVFDIVSP